MHPRPQLTPAEKAYLQAWIWEETNFQIPHKGTAKKKQVQHSPYAPPLLADIVAAAMTPEEQTIIASGSEPQTEPAWPWPAEEDLRARHREAKAWLESRFTKEGAVPRR